MDTKIALNELGFSFDEMITPFVLNQSNYPNHIVKWNSTQKRPTDDELQTAWESFLTKNPDWNLKPPTEEV
tara:strand:- start:1761 stop:1973 length:213 start_codon:yes stop_codon:yes gene_type:complete